MRCLFALAILSVVGCEHKEESEATSPPSTTSSASAATAKNEESKPTLSLSTINDWTHTELATFLEQHGVHVEVKSSSVLSSPERPVFILWGPLQGEGENVHAGAVIVYVCKDNRTALEQSGAMSKGSFTQGRFAFDAWSLLNSQDKALSQQLLFRIQSILNQKAGD